MNLTVSIIVVSWNTKDLLRSCLESVRNAQIKLTYEVIVVDNDSADGSSEMVSAEFPEVKLIKASTNLGFAGGNNLAIASAKADYIVLVNSDALVHPGCLELLSQALDSDPKAGMAGPQIHGGDGSIQGSCRRFPTVWNSLCRAIAVDRISTGCSLFSGHEMWHFKHDRPINAEVLSGCFLLVRTAAIEQVGLMDEDFFFYAEDVDWCKRFAEAGWNRLFIPKATATHLGAGSSALNPYHYSVRYHESVMRYWHKHHGKWGKRAYCAIASLHHGVRYLIRTLVYVASKDRGASGFSKRNEDAVCLRFLITGIPS